MSDNTEEKIEAIPPSPPQTPSGEEGIDYKDKYLRLLAEMENTRKRMQKEKLDTMRFAVENVLTDIIAPMDNLEGALKSATQMSSEVANWAAGFGMILSQFKDILQQHGVAPFTSQGERFDPHQHEAVETEETADAPEGTILQEYIKGYRCGDRVIRPARVKVAKKKSENKGE
jgi:molecular chaperone GrpE